MARASICFLKSSRAWLSRFGGSGMRCPISTHERPQIEQLGVFNAPVSPANLFRRTAILQLKHTQVEFDITYPQFSS